MFKAIKDNKIIAINEIGNFPCLVLDNVVEDTEHTLDDYEHYQCEFLLKSDIPAPTIEEQNETIRQTRQHLFTEQADPIKYDYDEACAIYGISSSQALQLKLKWLEKKEEIRKNNPYKEI